MERIAILSDVHGNLTALESVFSDIELLRVEPENEFAPIKDFFSVHNPEVAKELYEKKQKRMIFI